MLGLLENATLVASAPGGTAALRSLVLQLAMRGLLSTTEAGDTPVESLLEQIRRAKQQLHESGQLKRLRTVEPVAAEDPPYPLPPTWHWIRLAEVGHDWGQQEPTAAFTYIEVGSLDNKAGEIRSPQVVSASDASSRARKLVHQGTLIYSTIRPYLLNVAVLEQEFDPQPIASTAFAVIHPYCAMPSRFFFWWLRSPAFIRYVENVQTGIAYPAINDAQFFNGLTPLPPLEEQHRIVAKVDELMALCDLLEARQQDAEAAHARLVQALLDSLTQAHDADEFQAGWRRVAEQFNELVTNDSSLDALRAVVLELAFQGRLTARDGEEPWPQVKLGSVAKLINGDRGVNYPNRSEYVPEGIAFINTGHINPDGSLDLDAMHYLTREKFESLRSGKIEPGDLLYCLRGATLGKTAFVRPFTEGAIASSLVILRFATSVLPEFAYYFLVSPQGRRWIWKFDNGSAQPNLAASSVREYEMPLPSLDEQLQVVSRVTELLALCDQLKARIATARAKHTQLAEALVAQAVAA